MKTWIAVMVAVFLVCADRATAAREACVVCALNGETEKEEVAATRELGGQEVSFCSAKCAAEFDQDPYAYVFVAGPVPEMTFVSLAGDTITTSRLRGRIVVIDFWATWCKPCVESMPGLDALQRESKGAVMVVGVSVDQGDDRQKKVRRFLEKHAVGYAIALDAEADPAWDRLRVKVLPTLFVIAPDGTIVARHTGRLRLSDLAQEISELSSTHAD